MAANKKKVEVGKGIKALLANIDAEDKTRKKKSGVVKVESDSSASIGTVPVDWIEPNPFQPRTEFEQEDLEELITSIKTFGVVQPITVRRLSSKEYQLISGERRWRASKDAGLDDIPAYIREADDQAMLEIALLENIQRADLNAMEVALSYQRLIDECELTHEELSDRLGKKRSSITNYLRVLKLPAPVQKALKSKAISIGHAKVLAGIQKTEVQLLLLERILIEGLSVRGTERTLLRLNQPQNLSKVKDNPGILPEVRKIRDQLSDKIGGKVDINRSSHGKGTIKIHFGSDDEFNDIIESLLDR
ncbi:MAG: ParB/RepB/Spo0J family partition protein [Saprospiraceae bacterium]|nr:ParB/RepB/Spo0J family partition protein [Saprospiraceae bacterium]|tara:strand:+ start:442 stop:1356 length:915 start_codon:yes stop_codon:yes gene_type:complete